MKNYFTSVSALAIATIISVTGTSTAQQAVTEAELTAGLSQAEIDTLNQQLLNNSYDCPKVLCGAYAFDTKEELISASLDEIRLREQRNGTSAVSTSNSSGLSKFGRRINGRFIPNFGPQPQIVFLDFDAGGAPTFPVTNSDTGEVESFIDHIYTPEERDEIQRRMENDFKGINVIMTQDQPTSGDFTTISFGRNDDQQLSYSSGSGTPLVPGVLFGVALDGIDFRNTNRSDNVFMNASIWNVYAQLDPTGELFTLRTGIPIETTLADAVSIAIVNQSANTGAHELGHAMGLRHHDSFGAPGDGYPPLSPNLINEEPNFIGERNATETTLHLMSTGTTGTVLEGSVNADRFFSERSATKLAITNGLSVFNESEKSASDRGQHVPLRLLRTPNTIEEGVNEDAILIVDAAVVAGEISEIDEVDTYTFFGKSGDFINLEMVSVVDRRFTNMVWGDLKVFYENFRGERTEIAVGLDSFEAQDPLLIDVPLPETGKYIVEVSSPDEFRFAFTFFGVTVFISPRNGEGLTELGVSDLRVGDYELLFYRCNKIFPDEL